MFHKVTKFHIDAIPKTRVGESHAAPRLATIDLERVSVRESQRNHWPKCVENNENTCSIDLTPDAQCSAETTWEKNLHHCW